MKIRLRRGKICGPVPTYGVCGGDNRIGTVMRSALPMRRRPWTFFPYAQHGELPEYRLRDLRKAIQRQVDRGTFGTFGKLTAPKAPGRASRAR